MTKKTMSVHEVAKLTGITARTLHYIIGGFYFGTLGNATAYSILPISDGGLKYFFIHS